MRLVLETSQTFFISRKCVSQEFESDVAPEPSIGGAVYHAHTTLTNFLTNDIMTQGRSLFDCLLFHWCHIDLRSSQLHSRNIAGTAP